MTILEHSGILCNHRKEETNESKVSMKMKRKSFVLIIIFNAYTGNGDACAITRKDYCISVWDECNATLQKLRNRADKVITKSSYDVSANRLLTYLARAIYLNVEKT